MIIKSTIVNTFTTFVYVWLLIFLQSYKPIAVIPDLDLIFLQPAVNQNCYGYLVTVIWNISTYVKCRPILLSLISNNRFLRGDCTKCYVFMKPFYYVISLYI